MADARLVEIPGVPAEVFVEPSAEQWYWTRRAPWLLAPNPEEPHWAARVLSVVTVVPSTNLTNFSLHYQSYLYDVFHSTRLAKIGHIICMPIIVTSMIALARSFGGIQGAAALALLGSWYLTWAWRERDAVWGGALALTLAAMWGAAEALQGTHVNPLWLLVGGALGQMASHAVEPLPPRVSRSPLWVPVSSYLLKGTWHERLRHASHITMQFSFGFLQEVLGSPRILPVLVLEAVWALGWKPEQRQAWKDLSARAIASGNPALDYIGIGGGTPLRA